MADRDVLINENTMIAIANAIRNKSDSQTAYTPAQMPAAINQISGGSGGGSAITVTDTIDSHGGIIKTINAVDISDTTATAEDVASGEVFYTANGTRTVGTASVGGSSLVELLEDVTLTEDIHKIRVRIDGYRNQGYTSFALWVDLTVTAEDWIYYGIGRGESFEFGSTSYTAKTTTDTGWRSSFTDYGQAEFYSVRMAGGFETQYDITFFRVYCYTGNINIQAGSRYKLYGVKYATL